MTIPVPVTINPSIDLNHFKIHEGPFASSQIVSNNIQIANPKYILLFSAPLATPPSNTLFIHFDYSVSSNLGIITEFFENPTFSDTGILVPRFFNNRNFGVVPAGGEWQDPTITSEGTRLYIERIGSITRGGIGGPRYRDEDEIILRINTYYLIKVTPLINNVDITIKIFAYSTRAAPGSTQISIS